MKNDGKNKGIKRHGLFLLVLLLLLLPGAEGEAAAVGRTYECGWGRDVSLKGLFDSEGLYVQVGDWRVREAELRLEMNASRLINREVSYLSVFLDGRPVETIPIPESDGEAAVCTVALPAESFTPESSHSVTVEAYLRGQTTDACVDDSSLSTWLTIFSDSGVKLSYEEERGDVESIADFYERFVSEEALEERQCAVATMEGAPDAALTAMARILSGFARSAAGDVERIKGEEIKTEAELCGNAYVIYIDRFDRLPSFLLDAMTQTQKNCAKSSAVVCLADVRETKVLVVAGSDDTALKKAGDLLSNPERISTLTGMQEQMDAQEDYRGDAYVWEEYIPLTQFGAQLKGNFEQSASFGVYCPANRRLADSAQLSLDYRYSANLDFDKSLLTVYVNGIPVGSRALTEEGADGTTEVFSIPGDIDAVGSFTVETRFALYPKGDWCELTPEDIPWAYVADTSMLKWTTTENTEVFFEYYPFPFIKNGEFSETKVLLPSGWTEDDLVTMAGILLTMGSFVKSNTGELEVECSPEEETLDGFNLISIGSAAVNHQDTEELKILAHRGCVLLELTPDEEMLHARMIVTGKTGADMAKATAFLGKGSELWQVRGDLMYTDGEEVSCHYVRKPTQADEPPEVQPVREKDERSVPLLIVGSLFVLLLLSLAMLLIKYGREKSER